MSSSLFARSRTSVAVRRTVRRDAAIARMTRYRGGMCSPSIRNSFPLLGTAELSRWVRAGGGHLLGDAHLAEHEAIAATQVAIWHFTNGVQLDNRPRNVPVAVTPEPGAAAFEFDGEPQLGSYTVKLTNHAAVSLILQKSVYGVRWRDIAASGLNVAAGSGRHRRTIGVGVGATVSDSRPGRQHRGYRFYRLQVAADRATVVDIEEVIFTLNGSGGYRNAERVVALYNYVIAGAESSFDVRSAKAIQRPSAASHRIVSC